MITRDYAMVNRLKTYSDCKPCLRGHPACRYTKTGKCVHCHRENAKRDKMSIPTKNSIRRTYGLVPLKEYVHLDDVETVEAFCAALRMDRDIPNNIW